MPAINLPEGKSAPAVVVIRAVGNNSEDGMRKEQQEIRSNMEDDVKTKIIGASIEVNQVKRLKRIAEANRRTFSAEVAVAVDHRIEAEEKRIKAEEKRLGLSKYK